MGQGCSDFRVPFFVIFDMPSGTSIFVDRRLTEMFLNGYFSVHWRPGVVFSGFRHRFWSHFGDHFPGQIYEKIDARIYVEKMMKVDENSMRKLSYMLIVFEKCLHEKTHFSKKVHVRKSYESSIRMRVGKGSPKKKGNRKSSKIIKKHPIIGLEKGMDKYHKNDQKVIPKQGTI